MFKYENQICQVCQQTFDKDDDIVVCPECGTPHHRHCWHEQGDCVNRHKHAEGFEWKPAVKEVPADSVTCAECGANMPSGTLFCENCGKALAQPQQQASQSYTMPGGGRIEVHQVPPFGAGMPMGMGFDGGSALAGEIDGVAIKDMAAFIGPNAQYYIYKFKRMVADARYKPFNWTAFMFRPLWFLYRKLWKPAVVSAILNMVTRDRKSVV